MAIFCNSSRAVEILSQRPLLLTRVVQVASQLHPPVRLGASPARLSERKHCAPWTWPACTSYVNVLAIGAEDLFLTMRAGSNYCRTRSFVFVCLLINVPGVCVNFT